MELQTKVIFGNGVLINPNVSVAFSFALEISGTIHQNNAVESHILKVVFLTGDSLTLTKEILLARETNGYALEKPYKEDLFWKLHTLGFPENKKAELSRYLLDLYQRVGEVKEGDLIRKIDMLFLHTEPNLHGSACGYSHSR